MEEKSWSGRFFTWACSAVLVFVIGGGLLVSCATNGATPTTIQQILLEHEAVLKLGTQVAVIEGLKHDPSLEVSIVTVIDTLRKVGDTLTGASIKEMLYSAVDMTKFNPTEVAFFDAAFDEVGVQITAQRVKFCAKNPTSSVCVVDAEWLQAQVPYIKKFASWLQSGVDLYRQSQAR